LGVSGDGQWKTKSRGSRIVCLGFLAAGLAALSFFRAFAQGAQPRWREKLNCEPREQQVYQGVEYCAGKVSSEDGEHFAHVIVVDTHASGVRLEYIIAEGVDNKGNFGPCRDVNITAWGKVGCNDPDEPQYYPVMSFDRAIARAWALGAAALINGDYSACTQSENYCDQHGMPYRAHGPEGLTIVGAVSQERLDGPNMGDGDNNAVRRPFLIAGNGTPLRVGFHMLARDTGAVPCLERDPAGACLEWAYTGMGGGPWLIHGDAGIMEGSISSCENTPGSCYDSAIQTAAGQTQDKRWLFLVVAVKPEKLLDLARFMKEDLDCYQAIKLDGGGSSSMWYDGDKKYSPSRELTNFLAVIAEPGSGIDLSPKPGPEPEPFPRPSWFDSLLERWRGLVQSIEQRWQKFVQWWDEIRQTIEDLQEFLRNIQDPAWWAQQIENEVLQCCGGLLLPAGTAVLLWVKRTRRR
jgi:hypothetical protein